MQNTRIAHPLKMKIILTRDDRRNLGFFSYLKPESRCCGWSIRLLPDKKPVRSSPKHFSVKIKMTQYIKIENKNDGRNKTPRA